MCGLYKKCFAIAIICLYISIILCENEDIKSAIDLSHAFDVKVVYPRIRDVFRRNRRDINSNIYYEEENKLKIVELGDWVLELNINHNLLLTPQLASEWVSNDSSTVHQRLEQCDYKRGVVQGLETTSTVAMVLCESQITGFVQISEAIYFIQPLDRSSGSHLIYNNNKVLRLKRSSALPDDIDNYQQWEFFNLTGDIIEINDPETEITLDKHENEINNHDFVDESTSNNNSYTWWPEQSSTEEFGYFYDTAWDISFMRDNHANKKHRGNIEARWLKIAVAVDHTLIAFHGRERVEQYVLALMNIVSAIYQDSSLEANMKMVITRLMFYENKKPLVVRPGNAKKSLENVNSWNRRLHISLAPGETHHDVAVWLTRSDIGGPSGYAPVGGVCDFKRSCALNRDEGLTSAFIIAHEMAHILGLSHDGDQRAGNDCGYETQEGSVMAPMVSATFHKFTWSECSKTEFKTKSSKWTCLHNQPPGMGEILLNATIEAAFSMDEQCRMEFGEGYQLCRAFDIIEPCSHLWCGHIKSPLVCKTKKGPPLEGTECGFDKWCIDGYCEIVNRQIFNVPPVQHNPQDGGWSDWNPWGSCSRSCGKSVKFRTRFCNNPTPDFGGQPCIGSGEEWKMCDVISCPDPLVDLRAQQCLNIIGYLNITDRRANLTWQPYESDDADLKCQLICMSKETRELFVTGENLIDGTPCSYENENNICVQGICQPLGCNDELYSTTREDSCGICKGNNSECSNVISAYRKKIKKEVTRIAIIPRLARHIVVEANLTMPFLDNPTAAFILKNRLKRKYSIPIPSAGIHWEIIEGTKFYYKKVKSHHKIWARGPLLVEMVVLLYAPKSEVDLDLNISLYSEYYVKKSSLNESNRFNWVLGGWGPCSASCDGGRRHKTIACWDELNSKIIPRKYCSLVLKPTLPTEICNNYSCDFNWITGNWEPCSVTCGSYGTQSRELYCVPKSIEKAIGENNNETLKEKPLKYMVNPNKCAGLRPMSVRPCYRIPCLSYWEYGDWSPCSASCGSGMSTRSTHCPPPEGETFFTCGNHPPTLRKVCRGPFTRRNNHLCKRKKKKRCYDDKSKYCSLSTLSKYCKLRSFKRLCCRACATFTLHPFSI